MNSKDKLISLKKLSEYKKQSGWNNYYEFYISCSQTNLYVINYVYMRDDNKTHNNYKM